MKQTAFTARGELGRIPAGIWEKGRTTFAYLDVGNQRFDGVSVAMYLDASLQDCVGEQVELSFCRLGKGGLHLCAIKAESGKVYRLPDPNGALVSETIVGAVVFGLVTFITTFMASPILLGVPLYALRSVLPELDEKIFAPIMFSILFALWMAQLTWVLFYSKKLSPRLRIRVINEARTAFD
jgi:hypothetical protein